MWLLTHLVVPLVLQGVGSSLWKEIKLPSIVNTLTPHLSGARTTNTCTNKYINPLTLSVGPTLNVHEFVVIDLLISANPH